MLTAAPSDPDELSIGPISPDLGKKMLTRLLMMFKIVSGDAHGGSLLIECELGKGKQKNLE